MKKSLKVVAKIVQNMINASEGSYGVRAGSKDNWRTLANARPLTITRTNKSK